MRVTTFATGDQYVAAHVFGCAARSLFGVHQGDIVRPVNKTQTQVPAGRKGASTDHKEKSVGDALRAVYREAVDEQVPDELLDLLKKLD